MSACRASVAAPLSSASSPAGSPRAPASASEGARSRRWSKCAVPARGRHQRRYGGVRAGRRAVRTPGICRVREQAARDGDCRPTVFDLINAAGSVGRLDNSIKYLTPALGPASLEVVYAAGKIAGAGQAGRHLGAGLNYATGPLVARLAYRHRNSDSALVHTASSRNTLLAATCELGFAKLHLGYGVNEGRSARRCGMPQIHSAMRSHRPPLPCRATAATFSSARPFRWGVTSCSPRPSTRTTGWRQTRTPASWRWGTAICCPIAPTSIRFTPDHQSQGRALHGRQCHRRRDRRPGVQSRPAARLLNCRIRSVLPSESAMRKAYNACFTCAIPSSS